jgi:hypothetical protein
MYKLRGREGHSASFLSFPSIATDLSGELNLPCLAHSEIYQLGWMAIIDIRHGSLLFCVFVVLVYMVQ